MSMHRLITGTFVALGLTLATAAGAKAEDAHSHEGADGTELVLNNGAKWETDDPLRTGMAGLRDDIAAALPQIHDGAFTPAQYVELAGKVDGRIQYLVENCKLSPEADEQLHVVLVEIMDGAEAMKGESGQMQGAVKIVQALKLYPDYFDHPGWAPLGH